MIQEDDIIQIRPHLPYLSRADVMVRYGHLTYGAGYIYNAQALADGYTTWYVHLASAVQAGRYQIRAMMGSGPANGHFGVLMYDQDDSWNAPRADFHTQESHADSTVDLYDVDYSTLLLNGTIIVTKDIREASLGFGIIGGDKNPLASSYELQCYALSMIRVDP